MNNIFQLGILLGVAVCAPWSVMAQSESSLDSETRAIEPKNLGDPIGTIPLPSQGGSSGGLEDAGSNLFWHTDYGVTNIVYRINSNGAVVSSFSVEANTDRPLDITSNNISTLYIVDESQNEIDVYSTSGIFWGSFPVGNSPRGITYNPNSGTLFVVSINSNDVIEFSTAGDVLNTFTLSPSPSGYTGITYDTQRNGYWVLNISERIAELYSSDFSTVLQSFSVAPGDLGVAVKGNKLYVVHTFASLMYVYDITEFQLAAPFYLDNGTNLSGGMPTSGVAAFIGVKNMSAKSITLTITYTSGDGTDVTPANNIFVMAPNQGVSWRPAADDPTEGAGQAVPNLTGGFPAGSVLITADGPITGRLVELDGDNSMRSAYGLQKP
jgi:DNA-binding beta-propeller fold protein YncE